MALVEDGVQQYGYKNVCLLKNESLGSGSCGAVCKAKCDQLICAAKLLYPVLFQMPASEMQSSDPGKEHRQPFRRFEQECQFLSRVNHPNIVQYLGTYRDPETNAPVLLMELMDECLTHFLDSTPGDIPCHIQVNIAMDVAQALAFLHSNGIIHRDLSSNNVLLIEGSRAKVSDFGMSKFKDSNASHLATMTTCPGTQVFMPPEAFDEPPVYTEKLDNFSFGVLFIQIATRVFPAPKERFEIEQIPDRRNPKHMIEARVAIPEVERRQSHIDLIDPLHLLLPIALMCLKDEAAGRPSSQELCQLLNNVKKTTEYTDSSQRDLYALIKDKDKQIEEMAHLLRDKEGTIAANIKELQSSIEKVKQLEATVYLSTLRIEALMSEAEILKNEKQLLQNRNRELRFGRQRERIVDSLVLYRESISQRKLVARESGEPESSEEPENFVPSVRERKCLPAKFLGYMKWKVLDFYSDSLHAGSSAVIGDTAYFYAGTKTIHEFSFTSNKWSKLPECSFTECTIVAVDDMLITVGGLVKKWRGIPKFSNKLFCYSKKKWVEKLPPMSSDRSFPGAVYANNTLVVIGGFNLTDGTLTTVEILDVINKQWYCASSLPFKTSQPSVAICEDFVYLHAGCAPSEREAKSVVKCSLPALVESNPSSTIWERIASLETSKSSLFVANGHVHAVGGETSEGHSCEFVHRYSTDSDSWEFVSEMTNARCKCLTAPLPENKLLVVGDDSDKEIYMELASFS